MRRWSVVAKNEDLSRERNANRVKAPGSIQAATTLRTLSQFQATSLDFLELSSLSAPMAYSKSSTITGV